MDKLKIDNFNNCLRISPILDYVRIVVIDEGQIIEAGSPECLMKRMDSFTNLIIT